MCFHDQKPLQATLQFEIQLVREPGQPNQFFALSTNEERGLVFWMCVKRKSYVHCCDFPFFSFAVKGPGDVSEEDIPSIDCTQYCQLASAPWGSLELVRVAASICPYHIPSDASP